LCFPLVCPLSLIPPSASNGGQEEQKHSCHYVWTNHPHHQVHHIVCYANPNHFVLASNKHQHQSSQDILYQENTHTLGATLILLSSQEKFKKFKKGVLYSIFQGH